MFRTEIIYPADPRATLPEMTKAMKDKIKRLLERRIFNAILKEDVSPGANFLSDRFVLEIKSIQDGKIKFKARFVIGGHHDKLESLMVHFSQTIHPSSIRILLKIVAARRFDVWISSFRQA